jgi:UDP-2,4-diacetamido-2,4,6-trideoxy-beta-L-altropyranose hydrolase
MRVLFRTDASLTIGSGHLMRCLTLARALREQGHHIWFACRQHPGHLNTLIATEGFPVLALAEPTAPPTNGYAAWLGATETEDAAAVTVAVAENSSTALQAFDWLVVDHYGLGATFSRAMRSICRAILQIDDLANRPYDCDVLLDQNLLPGLSQRYVGLLPAGCQPLLGPRFALLRPEFAGFTPDKRQFPATFNAQSPARLLVFFGGSDAQNFTTLTINALQQLQDCHWLADIVIGQANPHRLLLQQLCAQDRRLTLLVQTPGMAGLMAAADLMIGAGGATHWERACLGLPAVVVALADNQLATTAYLAELGACLDLGHASALTTTTLTAAISALLAEPRRRQQLSKAASQLVSPEGGVPQLIALMQQHQSQRVAE